MSAKLVISLDGQQVDVCVIEKDVTTIGRDPSNDICISDDAISGFHCKIITILSDSFLEDLNSTNGTTINGLQVNKSPLSDGDEIVVGLHTISYKNPKAADGQDFNSTMIIRPDDAAGLTEISNHSDEIDKEDLAKVSSGTSVPKPEELSFLRILSGENSGKKLKLTKALTTIGKPGSQTAAITNRPDGYYIILVSGGASSEGAPKLNNAPLTNTSTKLTEGDLISVAGTRLEFGSIK